MLDQVLEGEKCTNVHMDIQILPLYYRTFSPFLTKAEKAGQGCQWPSLPSGKLVHTLLALLVSFASLSIPTSLSFYIFPFQLNIQSNATAMNRKGLKFFSFFGGLLLLPIYEIKKSSFMGQKNHFKYRQNYVTSGTSIAGCDCSWRFLVFTWFSINGHSHDCFRFMHTEPKNWPESHPESKYRCFWIVEKQMYPAMMQE